MIPRVYLLEAGAVALALTSVCGVAAPTPYVFDMAHSRLFFDYDHQGFSLMLGRFTRFDGELAYDEEHPESSRLQVQIDPASVDVFDTVLNDRLKGPDFFDVSSYPSIRFESRSVTVSGEDQLRVDGLLTMHGTTRPVSFEVHRNKFGVNRQGHEVAGFSARGKLKRADYGMDFLVPVIAEEVVFRIEIEAWPKTE